jgi:hypothetical protein
MRQLLDLHLDLMDDVEQELALTPEGKARQPA